MVAERSVHISFKNIEPKTIMSTDLESLIGSSPEEIAQILFSRDPDPPNSCRILADQDSADVICIFEVLTIILMEGLEVITGDLSVAKLYMLTEDHLMAIDPWFNSIGFKFHNVQVFAFKTDEAQYNGHYCKIVVRDALNKTFFEMKNIPTNYHFFLNGANLEENKLKTDLRDLHSIFLIGNTVFKISFDFLTVTPEDVDQ